VVGDHTTGRVAKAEEIAVAEMRLVRGTAFKSVSEALD
jgi:hypothetical protein